MSVVKLDYNNIMKIAAKEGDIETVKLCIEKGATDYDVAMANAALGGHIADYSSNAENVGAIVISMKLYVRAAEEWSYRDYEAL